jgi:hypothetical protein
MRRDSSEKPPVHLPPKSIRTAGHLLIGLSALMIVTHFVDFVLIDDYGRSSEGAYQKAYYFAKDQGMDHSAAVKYADGTKSSASVATVLLHVGYGLVLGWFGTLVRQGRWVGVIAVTFYCAVAVVFFVRMHEGFKSVIRGTAAEFLAFHYPVVFVLALVAICLFLIPCAVINRKLLV